VVRPIEVGVIGFPSVVDQQPVDGAGGLLVPQPLPEFGAFEYQKAGLLIHARLDASRPRRITAIVRLGSLHPV
jgi:hypothetical protein